MSLRPRISVSRAKFGPSVGGLAAVEFALLLPIMLAFVFAGFETVKAITGARRLTFLANAIAQQVTSNTSGSITNADMHFFYNTAMVVFPQVLRDASRYNNYWWQDIDVSVSSISFAAQPTGCTSGCTYAPSVIWSSGAYRSCVVPPLAVSDQASPSSTTLPLDVFGAGSLIVVDVRYRIHTMLSNSLISNYISGLDNLVLKKSVYVQPRYVPTIKYQSTFNDPGSDDIVTTCLINHS